MEVIGTKVPRHDPDPVDREIDTRLMRDSKE